MPKTNWLRWSGVIALLAAVLVEPAMARNVFGRDARKHLDPKLMPSLGRIVIMSGLISVNNTCTGTMIADRYVLTAAHCLLDVEAYEKAHPVPPLFGGMKIYFEPGFTEGHTLGIDHMIPVKRYWHGSIPKKVTDLTNNRWDWGVIELESPPANVPDFPSFGRYYAIETQLTPGMPLVAAGYSRDFEKGMSASVEKRCHLRRIEHDQILMTDCSWTPGASGGPIFSIWVDGEPLTAENESQYPDERLRSARVELRIAGVISSGMPGLFQRAGGVISGVLSWNLKQVSNSLFDFHVAEYTEDAANIGIGSTSFAEQVRAILHEGHESLSPGEPISPEFWK